MTAPRRIDFIVGMSRTGITWLTRALNMHPQLATFGQSRFWGKHFRGPADPRGYDAPELARIHRRLKRSTWDATVGRGPGCFTLGLDDVRHQLDRAWSQLRPPVPPSRAFEALAEVFATAGGADHVLEKTPHHILHIDRIRSHFPRARFVIIETGADDYAAIQRGQPDLRHHPIAVALLFRRYATACAQAARQLGDDAVRVQLRALAKDPDRALAPVFRVLGVEPVPIANAMPSVAEAVPEPFAGPPPAVDRFWIRRLSDSATRAEAGPRPSIPALMTSLLTLPPWALDNLRTNLADVEGSLFHYYTRWLGRR
ncbi:MAG: sulfotransferase [Deltaproteobacteria bacterium]|nr:sulfotransferase [Deltaproteobacteria bacterium]